MTIPRSRIARLRRIAFWRRLLTDTRGAVFAEVVVMLPFFMIVWASIFYVHKYYSSRIALGAPLLDALFADLEDLASGLT